MPSPSERSLAHEIQIQGFIEMKTPRIKCPCCKGSGSVLLGADYMRTLKRLITREEATTDDLGEDGVLPSAIAMRLRRMQRLGLVKVVRKESKNFVWTAV